MHHDPISPTTLPSAQSDTSSQSEIKATRHYRLTTEEWLQVVHDLKPRERDVLYYLRTLDPFGDRQLDIGVRDIARVLHCDASTVSRALKTLDVKGYIALELVNVQVKVLSTGNGVVWKQQSRSSHNKVDRETTGSIVRQQGRSSRNDRTLKLAPDMDFEPSHTLHTDQTLKTLSNSHPPTKNQERDLDLFDADGEPIPEYKAFLIRKADKLPEPVGIIELWLEKNSRKPALIRAYRKIQKQQVQIESSAAPPSTDLVETIEQKRQRYLSTWEIAACRPAIKKAIAANPDLKLEIVGDELREVEP